MKKKISKAYRSGKFDGIEIGYKNGLRAGFECGWNSLILDLEAFISTAKEDQMLNDAKHNAEVEDNG